MSFNRMLYFAAIVVGLVCFGTGFGNAAGILVGSVLIFFTALFFYISSNAKDFDQVCEFVLFVFFAIGLVSEIFVWNWVLALIIFMYFGTVFANWALVTK